MSIDPKLDVRKTTQQNPKMRITLESSESGGPAPVVLKSGGQARRQVTTEEVLVGILMELRALRQALEKFILQNPRNCCSDR